MTTPLVRLLDAEASFEDAPGGGLIIRKDQVITPEFLAECAEKRNSTERTGWLHEVAEVPTMLVEVWARQGFDILHIGAYRPQRDSQANLLRQELTLPSPARSNCLVWALCIRHLYGGRIRFRKSLNWPGPHWYVVLVNGEAWSYAPLRPLWPIPWDLLWFRGYVKPEGA